MNIEKFIDFVKENIKDYLPAEYADAEVSINTVRKNNGRELQALTVIKKGRNIAPTLYLDEFYHEFMETEDIDTIMEDIARLRIGLDPAEDFMIDKIVNYEYAKNKISLRAINKDMNREKLEEVPYIELLDLAITFHIVVEQTQEGTHTAQVTREIMKSWGVTEQDLMNAALDNMEELTPAEFKSMSEVVKEMMSDLPVEVAGSIAETIDDRMYVLQSKTNTWGAALIANDNMLQTIMFLVGAEYYIIPSSVHELLIIPIKKDNAPEPRDLRDMVREVNDTQVVLADRLSYNIYKYSNNGLEIA